MSSHDLDTLSIGQRLLYGGVLPGICLVLPIVGIAFVELYPASSGFGVGFLVGFVIVLSIGALLGTGVSCLIEWQSRMSAFWGGIGSSIIGTVVAWVVIAAMSSM